MRKAILGAACLAVAVVGSLVLAAPASAKAHEVELHRYGAQEYSNCVSAGNDYKKRTGKDYNCVEDRRSGEWVLAVWP